MNQRVAETTPTGSARVPLAPASCSSSTGLHGSSTSRRGPRYSTLCVSTSISPAPRRAAITGSAGRARRWSTAAHRTAAPDNAL